MTTTKFYRMELSQPPVSSRSPESIDIVQYSRASHHDVIRHLYGVAFGEEPWPQNWDEFDEFDAGGVFLAKDSPTGNPVGYVICFRRNGFGYISVVAVVPPFRRKNIATALIHKGVEYLRLSRLSRVVIDVEVGNRPAVEAYRKLGFKVVRTFEGS